ncbi:MAG: porin family protein [Proteobacteria bacterium]|nr:porin family protein [Pseudomonadota bacterium]
MSGRTLSFMLLTIAPWLAVSPLAAGEAVPFDWRGWYIGSHSGGALSLVDVGNPNGSSIFGGTVRTPGPLAGGQLGYNWQRGAAVFGVEADMSWADMDGTNSCFANSGMFISSNCTAHIDALGTISGRLGWALPFDSRTLIFGKAGIATAHSEIDAVPNSGAGLAGTGTSNWHWGWTLGAGVERAVAPRWTVKAEYDFLGFDDERFTEPASLAQETPPGGQLTATPATGTSVSQDIHVFKIGVNYRFGADNSFDQEAPRPLPDEHVPVNRTEYKAGVRYVHGWGQFHKDLGIRGQGVGSLASRLTYDSPGVDGAEAFARIDTSFGLMVKGFVGGASSGGRLNDEDWGLEFEPTFIPYSNTISSVDDRIEYWTVDVGYDWWRGATYKIAPFVGYSHFQQNMVGLGCEQIANPSSDCGSVIPTSVHVITEDDTWRSLRLGTAIDIALAPRLTLAGEAAYLPYVQFSGTDDHVLRSLLSPEDGHGVGMQLEATLSYALTDALSIGVGGRYLSMWTTSGEVDFGGTGELVPMRYSAEQAQLLVQGSYKFGFARSP